MREARIGQDKQDESQKRGDASPRLLDESVMGTQQFAASGAGRRRWSFKEASNQPNVPRVWSAGFGENAQD